jgi:rhamnulokinase
MSDEKENCDTETIVFLAVDLGAESGRVVAGHFDGERIKLEELHRFQNGPVAVLDSLHWDVLQLWQDIKRGLAKAAQTYDDTLASIGLDTWGVDFGLLAADDKLLGNPYHYRDSRTDGMMEVTFDKMPRAEIFEHTGIQFIQLNSLYQLMAMVEAQSPVLNIAETFLNMPDLFNFWLTGRRANEFTIATTTQCYNPRTEDWATEMLDTLGIPSHMFGEIVAPGTVLDTLRPSVADETDCPLIPVIAPATHDTGSAVAAVPMTGNGERPEAIYLSSGTWSLMGVEVKTPIVNDKTLAYNFTNEGGVGGTFRVLKNIMGLWLVQECKREWEHAGDVYSYDELTQMAAEAPAFGPLVVPSDTRFLPPGDMAPRIQAFCRETGQAVPESRGAILRCAQESLALEYRWVAERLDDLVGHRLDTIHIIGGGSKNNLLNQLAADATGRQVVAGPVEATALGNVLVQALALGHIDSIADGREIIRRSFALKTFTPQDTEAWEEAYAKYVDLRRQAAVD